MGLALEARDITKVYGHVSALSGANFEVQAGEVVALIGDNGAGWSRSCPAPRRRPRARS
jgi:simple sugar transport system ATP-binding protein